MPKKSLENLTESMFYVLMAFGRGAMCGIEVADFIEMRTDGRIQMGPATLYTILGKFEQEGYIEEIAVEGRKRTYQITDRGRMAYREEVARLSHCVADAAAESSLVYEADNSSSRDRDLRAERGLQVCPC